MEYPRPIRALAGPVLIFVLIAFSGCTKKAQPTHTDSTSAARSEDMPVRPPSGPSNIDKGILYYVNLHRHAMGLPLLQLNKVESEIAAGHSKDMASGRTPFGHMGLQSRVDAISRQLGPVSSTGENVALGQRSPKEVVADWLQSPGHRKNIEGDFKWTGIGLARDSKGVIYYTQIFTR
ncbi:MAG TPA: CAP domain-containing protein [Puia sp.]|nr:CAP domain-containing protein [Puia sp.]